MRDTIDMAREAGFKVGPSRDGPDEVRGAGLNLRWFEALVRADEAEKYKWDVHSCGPTCTRVACVALREAVQSEREACAKDFEAEADTWAAWPQAGAAKRLGVAAIRARGETK